MTEDLAPAISLATQLRQAGIRTQIQAERKKFKQKLSYADKLRIPYAVILGEDEIREGLAAVKDLATGEQVKLAPGPGCRPHPGRAGQAEPGDADPGQGVSLISHPRFGCAGADIPTGPSHAV